MKYKLKNKKALVQLLSGDVWGLDNNIFHTHPREFRVFESFLHELAHAAVMRIQFGPTMVDQIGVRFGDIESPRRSDDSELRALAVQFAVLDSIVHPFGTMRKQAIFSAAVLAMCGIDRSYRDYWKTMQRYLDSPATKKNAAKVLRYVERLDKHAAVPNAWHP